MSDSQKETKSYCWKYCSGYLVIFMASYFYKIKNILSLQVIIFQYIDFILLLDAHSLGKRRISKATLAYCCIFIFHYQYLRAEVASDTTYISFKAADSLLVNHNFRLLASKYRINAQKALERQAKLWDNPNIYLEQSAFNQKSKRVLPFKSDYPDGSQGQNIITVQQLFQLAGKRNKRFAISKLATSLSETEFDELIRELRYYLRTKLLDCIYRERNVNIYKKQILDLQRTIGQYDIQVNKGNVALKELVRLEAFLFSLQNELRAIELTIQQNQADIRTLLGISGNTVYFPKFDNSVLNSFQVPANPSELINLAISNRPIVKSTQLYLDLNKATLNLEKANATPDLRLGAVYDRNGSYISNYFGVSAAFDLPLLNRNQGNIKSAESQVLAAEAQQKAIQNSIEQEVLGAWNKAQKNANTLKNLNKDLLSNFNKLMAGLSRSYEQRYITLLEFIDYFESYKSTVLQFNELENDTIDSFEELNHVTGTQIYYY